MTAPSVTVAQTLPRTHRCDATIGRERGDFGFLPVTCTQRVGVATYISTRGLRVGYCSIDGHEANVRRRFAERPGPAPARRMRVEGCPGCIEGAPPHDASARCESGARDHCSCDGACF